MLDFSTYRNWVRFISLGGKPFMGQTGWGHLLDTDKPETGRRILYSELRKNTSIKTWKGNWTRNGNDHFPTFQKMPKIIGGSRSCAQVLWFSNFLQHGARLMAMSCHRISGQYDRSSCQRWNGFPVNKLKKENVQAQPEKRNSEKRKVNPEFKHWVLLLLHLYFDYIIQ